MYSDLKSNFLLAGKSHKRKQGS